MASLLSRFRGGASTSSRDAFTDHFLFNGQAHPLWLSEPPTTMQGSPSEDPPQGFEQTIRIAHRRGGLISAAVVARALIMSQLRFQWRSEIDGATFGNQSLGVLERPAPGMTREQLLWRVEQDVSYLGNAYVRRLRNGQLRRLRPDWVRIVLASDEDPQNIAHGADVYPIGYLYQAHQRQQATLLALNEVAHIAPEPDPTAHYRGESWVSGVVREILIDLQATDHLDKYFANATTTNMVVKAPQHLTDPVKFSEWVDAMDRTLTDNSKQWRNIYLGHGSDVQVVGASLADLDLKNLVGGIETRVTARSRVHPVILGAREGLQGSSLNAGNYNTIRRLWADGWFAGYAPSWCSSLERIVPRPAAAELTYDPARIPFLQEDMKDAADIFNARSAGIRQLVDGGFEPSSVVDAARRDDLAALRHTGNLSVQLQPDGIAPQEGATDE